MSDRRFGMLEAMRGCAAIWVLAHHGILAARHFAGPVTAPFIENGYLGVDFFFVLSGFIIAFSVHRLSTEGGTAVDYFSARLIRIYVPYLPIGVGIYLLYLILPDLSEGNRAPGLLTSLTLLPTESPPALSVAWTLVHEVIFYAIYSLWFVSRRALAAAMAIWVAAILVALPGADDLSREARYFLSPLNLCFVLGTAIFFLNRALRASRSIALAGGALGLLLVLFEARTMAPDRVVVATGFGLLVFAASTSAVAGHRVWRPLLALGSASYAIYLVHNPALSLAARGIRMVLPHMAVWGAFTSASLIALVAGVAYWWVYERHALRFVRRIVAGRGVGRAGSAG